MNEIMKDVTGVAMAIVGLALLYTLVNPSNKTASVISAASSGFGGVLSAAMGGGTQNNGLTAFGMN
jgi:hypothetical protein